MLHKSSSVLCHFREVVCAASPKACLQSAISLQNVKSHHHRAKEKGEGENLGRKHGRGELREQQLQSFSVSLSRLLLSAHPTPQKGLTPTYL